MNTTTAETPQTATVPESGMFAPYVPPTIGEPLDKLEKLSAFVLLGAVLREGIATAHGTATAVDLHVATTVPGEIRVFSGFAKAAVGQVRRMTAGDLPAVVALRDIKLENGVSREIVLIQPIAAGADVAGIASSLPEPLRSKAA